MILNHLDNPAFLHELGIGPRWLLRTPATPSLNAEELSALPAHIAQMDWTKLTQAVHDCRACPRAGGRHQSLSGEGDQQADWLFVGDAPDAEQDQENSLRAGSSARLFDNMLAALDLSLGQQVYLSSAVKCHAPSIPAAADLTACHPYLARQITLLQPKVIVALGAQAAATLLGIDSETALVNARGSVHRFAGLPLIVTHAPADLLLAPAAKAQTWADLCLARQQYDFPD